MEVEFESTDVVESTDVKFTDVVESTDVVEFWRDVERVGGVRGSSGETLYPLECERFAWSHVVPAGTREVRLVTR